MTIEKRKYQERWVQFLYQLGFEMLYTEHDKEKKTFPTIDLEYNFMIELVINHKQQIKTGL